MSRPGPPKKITRAKSGYVRLTPESAGWASFSIQEVLNLIEEARSMGATPDSTIDIYTGDDTYVFPSRLQISVPVVFEEMPK